MISRILEFVGELRARRRNWSPEGQRVELEISETADPSLFGRRFTGRIVAVRSGEGERLPEAEIALDAPLTLPGQIATKVIAAPHFRHHSWPRLLAASIDATLSTASLSDTDARKDLRSFGRAIIRPAR